MTTTDKIYPLDETAIALAEESQESESIFELLKARKITKEEFLTAMGSWYQNTEAKHRALEAEYKPLIDEMKADLSHLEDKMEFIKKVVIHLLPPSEDSELVTDSVRLFYSPRESIEITDPGAIPIELSRVREPEPDKKAIKAALEAGEDVPGAHIKTEYHLQIKAGGVRAIHNAKQRQKKLAKAKEEGVQLIDEN